MPQSTPIDQLSGGGIEPTTIPPADEERVKRILAEINADSVVQSAPPLGQPQPIITEPPITTSTGQVRMDPGTARANVIGNSTPTMADFQAMLQQVSPGMAPYHGPVAAPPPSLPVPGPKPVDWRTAILQHLRAPFVVGVIVFLMNMPAITSVFSRYASWMYLSSGEISISGLLVKTLVAMTLFLLYQTVASVVDR
jgi:hypothetical protein